MKFFIFRLTTAILILGAVALPAIAQISILVDEIHGRPLSEDLAEALPMCSITPLKAEDFPITNMISTGFITEWETEILFMVPMEAQTLYLRFGFSDSDFQLPFITLYGPDDNNLGNQCEGSIHIEAPLPGQYRLIYSTWRDMTTDYEIGIGPTLFTSGLLDEYDIVCNLWDDTMLMFRGELPPYCATDEAAYVEYIENGGGFLYLREPLIEMALKPIINIYSGTDVVCHVNLSFPGIMTYAEPPCISESTLVGTWLRWHDLQVSADQPTQILYEGKMRRQTNWLQLNAQNELPIAINRTNQPLNELILMRFEGAGNWRLVRLGTVDAGAEIPSTTSELLDESALKAFIENLIHLGGRQAGLYENEMVEFLAHYHWADRWLVDAAADGQWCGLYRIGAAAYDAHIPFQGEPPVSEQVRTMWIWATGLGDDSSHNEPIGADWPLAAPTFEATAPIIYHEYGVQIQRGPGTSKMGSKDFGFLGWTFYDGGALLDDTDNCGYNECPWFSWTGGHPDVNEFMDGVSVVQGHFTGTLTAPLSEQVLIGDDDAYTDDLAYPPGTYPPMIAAKSVGLGRAAAIHDLTILDDSQDNRIFLGNVVTWLANALANSQNIPSPRSHLDALTPNPFNPQLTVSFTVAHQQPVTITVCDLAGKRVATLVEDVYPGGEHKIVWDGKDDGGRNLPSGAFLIHMVTADAEQTLKAILVR